jgi:hypothetical protein
MELNTYDYFYKQHGHAMWATPHFSNLGLWYYIIYDNSCLHVGYKLYGGMDIKLYI